MALAARAADRSRSIWPGGTWSTSSRTARRRAGCYSSGDFVGCLDQAERAGPVRQRVAASSSGPRETGVCTGSASPAWSSPRSRTWATSPWWRTRRPAAARCPSRATPKGATVTINPMGGVSVQVATTPQGQGHATVIAQVVADALGIDPAEVQVVARPTRRPAPGRSPGQLLVAVPRRRGRRGPARRRGGGRQAAEDRRPRARGVRR